MAAASSSQPLGGAAAAAALVAALAACSGAANETDPPPPVEVPPPSLELVGHTDLGARGMNAALAVVGDYVYVGSRTDGGSRPDAGVMIVDARDPAAPVVVGQIGPPDESLLGMSSRELRAIPDRQLLIVMNFACSRQIHVCARDLIQYPATEGAAESDNLKIYDVSAPTQPLLVATFDFGTWPGNETAKPHEMFLWRDPNDPARTLLYVSTPPGPPSLQVIDLTDVGNIRIVASWDAFTDGGLTEARTISGIHSVSVSDDGTRAYLSHLGAGFFMLDTSNVAAGVASPAIRALTPIDARIDYVPPEPVGTHSAVPIPGRPLVLLTDEVYPPPVAAGCPWGWGRIVEVADPARPVLVSELRIAENQREQCPDAQGGPLQTTFTAHNPTVTEHLAFITWHSGGLQVVDSSDPAAPVFLTSFSPEPLASVAVEDPMFAANPVAMWSYPVVKGDVIWVVDVRNGLYALRYRGPYEGEVAGAAFLEGNSNLR